MILRRCAAAILAGLVLTIGLAGNVSAQTYPTKPVRILVGAGPDLVARVLAQKFTEAFGQQFVVEQLPAAGGLIAGQTVMKARPDGYTLLFSTATYVALQAYRPDTTFDLAHDFTPIGKIGEGPAVLYAHPSLGVKNLAELLKVAKEKPGQINCGSTGPGTQAISDASCCACMAKSTSFMCPITEWDRRWSTCWPGGRNCCSASSSACPMSPVENLSHSPSPDRSGLPRRAASDHRRGRNA